MRQPEEAIREFILAYEGNKAKGYLSLDPVDSGNWFKGKLIGSNYGVTGAALAKFRKVPSITKAQMAAVTLDEAVKIGMADYYIEPGFSELQWSPATEAWVDHGWLSGPVGAVLMVQRMLEVAADTIVGPFTIQAYSDWLQQGTLVCTQRVAEIRIAHFNRIVASNPLKRKYIVGWKRRALAFTSINKLWWAKWKE